MTGEAVRLLNPCSGLAGPAEGEALAVAVACEGGSRVMAGPPGVEGSEGPGPPMMGDGRTAMMDDREIGVMPSAWAAAPPGEAAWCWCGLAAAALETLRLPGRAWWEACVGVTGADLSPPLWLLPWLPTRFLPATALGGWVRTGEWPLDPTGED